MAVSPPGPSGAVPMPETTKDEDMVDATASAIPLSETTRVSPINSRAAPKRNMGTTIIGIPDMASHTAIMISPITVPQKAVL